MAHKTKHSLRSWMFVYLSFAAALAAAGGERGKPTAVPDISKPPMPVFFRSNTEFFAPAGPTVRRNDI